MLVLLYYLHEIRCSTKNGQSAKQKNFTFPVLLLDYKIALYVHGILKTCTLNEMQHVCFGGYVIPPQ